MSWNFTLIGNVYTNKGERPLADGRGFGSGYGRINGSGYSNWESLQLLDGGGSGARCMPLDTRGAIIQASLKVTRL